MWFAFMWLMLRKLLTGVHLPGSAQKPGLSGPLATNSGGLSATDSEASMLHIAIADAKTSCSFCESCTRQALCLHPAAVIEDKIASACAVQSLGQPGCRLNSLHSQKAQLTRLNHPHLHMLR